jgi:hypothetical protein
MKQAAPDLPTGFLRGRKLFDAAQREERGLPKANNQERVFELEKE